MSDAGSTEATEEPGGRGMSKAFEQRFELIIAILLGLAAVVGAVSAYETGIKDGDTLAAFQDGNRTADKASRLKAEVQTKRAEDQIVQTFAIGVVLNANLAPDSDFTDEANEELGNSLLNLVGSPELKEANKKCTADKACDGPPIDSKYYVVPLAAEAAQLDEQADAQFAAANKADKEGDDYSLVTIFLATSLFLYGVAAVGRGRSVKLGMAGTGAVIFLVALVLLVSV